MSMNLTQKVISRHLVNGNIKPGQDIGLKTDQTLTQDATGTMAYLQWEAMGLERVKTELSVSYVDHNTLQMGYRNPDDHVYLRSVAQKYGIVFSPPGTGICHQLHLENFARPGKTLLGSDSHTPTAGGVGSLAIGAGGLSVALAMAGEPYLLRMPKVINVYLQGELKGWSSAKDIILCLLSKLGVKGGLGAVFEYSGPGVKSLSVPERATITNMGAELGATSSIFPSDQLTKDFLRAMHREEDFQELAADPDADYQEIISLDLDKIEPMAACPHMPDKGVPVRELKGLKVDQVCLGSCTNSSYLDLSLAAHVLKGQKVCPGTEMLLSPGSKQVLKMLSQERKLEVFLDSGARLLECACGPCIGMGGAPRSGGVSLRNFNRNFEGRSGTQDAKVYLVSPVTGAQSAVKGMLTSPEEWGSPPPKPNLPESVPSIRSLFIFPEEKAADLKVERGPNIVPLSKFSSLPSELKIRVVLQVEDNITTDHILPGGAEITAMRSNVPEISKYVFSRLDPGFADRAVKAESGVVVGGENYGQGSSREHAALAPRYLGIRAVLAKSFARIHRANLINFGILPLIFVQKKDYKHLKQGEEIYLNLKEFAPGSEIEAQVTGRDKKLPLRNDLTENELQIILAGGMLNFVRQKRLKS